MQSQVNFFHLFKLFVSLTDEDKKEVGTIGNSVVTTDIPSNLYLEDTYNTAYTEQEFMKEFKDDQEDEEKDYENDPRQASTIGIVYIKLQ